VVGGVPEITGAILGGVTEGAPGGVGAAGGVAETGGVFCAESGVAAVGSRLHAESHAHSTLIASPPRTRNFRINLSQRLPLASAVGVESRYKMSADDQVFLAGSPAICRSSRPRPEALRPRLATGLPLSK
jgi:hypothetical protein